MDDVRKTLAIATASLQALGAHTKALGEELKTVTARVGRMDDEIQQLNGTFASLGTQLVTLYERDAEMRAWRETIEKRVKTLEDQQPPAA